MDCKTQISTLQDRLLHAENDLKARLNMDSLAQTQQKISHLRKKLVTEKDLHCKFLLSLHKDLTGTTFSGSNADSMSTQSNKRELSAAIKMSVQSLVKSSKQNRVELECTSAVMMRQKSLLESATKMHEDAVGKLSYMESGKEHSCCCEDRFVKLKLQYDSLLSEQDRLVTVLQMEAKSCVDEMKELKKQKQEFENYRGQLDRLKCTHKVYKTDRACLLSCVCLLVGTLFPLSRQVQQLCSQKRLLCHIMSEAKQQNSCSMSNNESSSSNKISSQDFPLLHHFRVIVLAILAANRLRKLANQSSRLQMRTNSDSTNSQVIPLYLGLKSHKKSGSSQFSDGDIARWLRSELVLDSARQCMSGLQCTLDLLCGQQWPSKHFKDSHRKSLYSNGLKELVWSGYLQFLERMRTHFQDQFP